MPLYIYLNYYEYIHLISYNIGDGAPYQGHLGHCMLYLEPIGKRCPSSREVALHHRRKEPFLQQL